ncbi:MAG: alpha/beta hydrolase fold domain-containing protein, partial [Acidobacteria bacterium]|nr:alpha/beta hydrolase fold domain-containing protein [Acidobacteriota bacterium]
MIASRPVAAHFGSGLLAGMALLLLAVLCLGQDEGKRNQEIPAPTHKNVPYGAHERNALDFWQAKSDKPAPLVVFIHGGGFTGGSKDQINANILNELLEAGISVAAMHYRLLKDVPLPAAHQDA